MFRQHLNHPSSIIGGFRIPLEVPVRNLESRIELVGSNLVRREDPEGFRVHFDYGLNECADTGSSQLGA